MFRTFTNITAVAAATLATYGLIVMTHVIVPFLALPWIVGFIQGGIHHENKNLPPS
jgi:hypothetical protein